MSNNAHELSNRLLNALDNNYNVVDMHTVNEIISVLERLNITKELLETTRLGKHVNELRRKTTDPSLARRAKVLVKRWRDLVIPTVASPGHTGSNRSSAERTTVRARLGGNTPLTSPALSRQVVSPAVNSPRPPSRPAWGGYESDSQDVILVDDEPVPPLPAAPPPPPGPSLPVNTHRPVTPPVNRPPSPEPLFDEKKAKRDKKPKKKRGHSRAGSGTEATAASGAASGSAGGAASGSAGGAASRSAGGAASRSAGGAASGSAGGAASGSAGRTASGAASGAAAGWGARNGTHERRRNGTKRDALDSYAALVNRMPPAGAKKVKTTKELLEQIQSRGSKLAASPSSPRSPASPASPDVMLIEPDVVKAESPLRNGATTPRPPSPPASPSPPPSPLEEPREWHACTCGDVPDDTCPAADTRPVRPRHVHALHHAHVPGVNGTRAPALPHRFAVRPIEDPERPGLFSSVVPLYKYSDYADDYCAKNLSRVQLCADLPWTSFAPPPPDLPPPPEPPPLRPYPEPEPETVEPDEDADELDVKPEVKREPDVQREPDVKREPEVKEEIAVEAEMVGVPTLEPSERLKAPILMPEDETSFGEAALAGPCAVVAHSAAAPSHRSVPRTKAPPGGAALVHAVRAASAAVPYSYQQLSCAPVLTRAALSDERELSEALAGAPEDRDALGRPAPAHKFAEWHECATLGELIALPYVVID